MDNLCTLCGSSDIKELGNLGDVLYGRCRDCGWNVILGVDVEDLEVLDNDIIDMSESGLSETDPC